MSALGRPCRLSLPVLMTWSRVVQRNVEGSGALGNKSRWLGHRSWAGRRKATKVRAYRLPQPTPRCIATIVCIEQEIER